MAANFSVISKRSFPLGNGFNADVEVAVVDRGRRLGTAKSSGFDPNNEGRALEIALRLARAKAREMIAAAQAKRQ